MFAEFCKHVSKMFAMFTKYIFGEIRKCLIFSINVCVKSFLLRDSLYKWGFGGEDW